MNFTVLKDLPTAEDIIQKFPLSEAGYERIERDKREVRDILAGRDSRMLVMVGPCSAWPSPAVLEFASRLKALDEKLRDKLKLVMRVYIQKPRTTKGWTGPVTQPNPFEPANIAEGVMYARELMVKVVEMGLPIADEALFTHNAKGFIELLSWIAVGARSTEDQEHRIFASAIDCAVGMKNPTSGSIEIGVNGVLAAQRSHVAVFNNVQVETHGNPFAHLVLRGGVDRPNYSVDDLREAKNNFEKHTITNPAIVIDASHDNCKVQGEKRAEQQREVILDVMHTLNDHPELRPLVKGFMLESFLKQGSQKLESVTPETVDLGGLSITDPCLGWDETEALLTDLAQLI